MLDIAAAREGFRGKVISDIGFMRSSKNIADGLTKSMSQAALEAAYLRKCSRFTLSSGSFATKSKFPFFSHTEASFASLTYLLPLALLSHEASTHCPLRTWQDFQPKAQVPLAPLNRL